MASSIMLASARNSTRFFTSFVRTRKYMKSRDIDVDICVYQMEPVIPGETPRQLPLFDDNMTLFGSGTEIAGAVKDTALVSC